MSLDWEGIFGYLFPPTALLQQVLLKLRDSGPCDMILIAPLWLQQPWYRLLLDLMVDYPLECPLWRTLLKQPRRPVFHSRPEIFHLHAFRLSNRASSRKAFLQQLQAEWLEPRRRVHSKCMRESGEFSAIGAVNGIWIHSRPLLT
jgi:hypothetical protein